MRAFLGLGSNVGERRAIPELVAVAPVYETEPVGGPEQGLFLNIVVQLDTERPARELLALCHELEEEAGRVREVHWGPRTLDVDVLWIDGVEVDEDDLVVPHPRMAERNFVMVPLLDLAPDIELPGYDAETAVGEVRNIGPL